MAAGSLTNVLIIGTVIFAIAMIMPIFFDVDFPQRGETLTLIERALCTIYGNGGGNYTCTVPDDYVFFNGTGINIFANDTERTVYFTVDVNGTITTCSNIGPGEGVCSGPVFSVLEFKSLIGGTDINLTSDANSITIDFTGNAGTGENTTAVSLGGDTDVFASEVGDQLRFRGLTAGNGIILTENANDIVINSTATGSAGVNFAILTAAGATLQSPLSESAKRVTVEGTNVDYLTLEYDTSGTLESAVWQFQVPTDFDSSDDIDIQIRFTQETGSAGGICWQGEWLGRTDGETIDSAFGTTQTSCDTTLDTAGDLSTATMTFTSGQHGLAAGDSVFFKITRATANGSDTHGSDARFFDAKVTWTLT